MAGIFPQRAMERPEHASRFHFSPPARRINPDCLIVHASGIADVRNRVEPDQDYVRKITGPFTWEGIFDRIESVYRQAVEDR